MSGFEIAAAAIGVGDIAFKNILACYKYFGELKDAPDQVVRIRNQLQALHGCLKTLKSVATSNQRAKNGFDLVDLPASIERCGTTCADLESDLTKWTKSGPENVISKMKVVQHKSKIKRYTAEIVDARGTITLGVAVANVLLASESASKSELQTQVDQVRQRVSDIAKEAKEERQDAISLKNECQEMISQDEDDAGAALAIQEAEKQKSAGEDLWAKCEVALGELKKLQSQGKLDLDVGDVTAEGFSTNEVAVLPASVADKVNRINMKVGNVKASGGSHNRVGVIH